MPPDPPSSHRLWRLVIPTPLHEILDLPQEIPLENAGNGICKTLDFKIFLGVGVPTIFSGILSAIHFKTYWEEIRKVNFWQCQTLNAFCFRSAPVPRWGRQPPPDPSLVWGPLAPIAVYFQNITVYFKSYWQPWVLECLFQDVTRSLTVIWINNRSIRGKIVR